MRTTLWALAFLLGACGATTKRPAGPHLSPHDDVGDVVTGSMSAPESPGVASPAMPGGPGGGGGTIRPR